MSAHPQPAEGTDPRRPDLDAIRACAAGVARDNAAILQAGAKWCVTFASNDPNLVAHELASVHVPALVQYAEALEAQHRALLRRVQDLLATAAHGDESVGGALPEGETRQIAILLLEGIEAELRTLGDERCCACGRFFAPPLARHRLRDGSLSPECEGCMEAGAMLRALADASPEFRAKMDAIVGNVGRESNEQAASAPEGTP